MYLVLVTALVAVCGADKLDRTYLPPASAHSAGGSSGSLQTPFRSFNQGLGGLPKGGYRNEFDGVVVDAAAPGTRASGPEVSGLGRPRISYGSTDSKVGEAAFTGDVAFPRVGVHSGNRGAFGPERIQTSRDRASNTVKYENEVSHDSFNYAFETDNGILAEENGVEVNGVKAQGGYSYTGDDGQVYSVTYTADEEGYRPRGDHLPTPPPIPAEILKSLEQNAKEEAAGIVDDGSYDAQKYNTGEDYTKSDRTNENYNVPTRLGSRPQTDAVFSSSFISQNNQAFVRPGVNQFGPSSATAGGLNPFDSSKNVASNNNIGIASNVDKTAHHGQAFGFGSGSNNEYLPPTSNIGRPGISNSNQPFGVQSQQQNSAYNSGTFGINNVGNKDQNTEKTFIPLSQQKLQSDNFKKPQGGSPIFGRPTVIDSTLSIKDPFANRPTGNKFTQNKQTSQKTLNNGQIGGSFEVVSGNVYSSKNEYLPPQSQFKKPTQNGNQGSQASSFGSPTNVPLPDLKPQSFGFNSNTPAATAFASASKPTFGFQSQINSGQQSIQHGGNGLPGFGQTSNSHLNSNNGQTQFTSSPSQTQYKPSTFGSQYPTLQPQTEFTTPLESISNEKSYSPSPVVDGPGSNLGSTFSSQSSFGAQPISNSFGQSTFNKYQQASPTQATASAFGSIGAPATSGLQIPSSFVDNAGAQFLNKSPFDAQFSSNTPRPSFSQNTQEQGLDDSYYYNTPSKPFNVPTARPQASQFPSSSSNQPFRVTQTPFGAKPGSFDFSQTSFASQTGSTRYPKPSSLEPISPTLPSGNTFQSQFNKVTQASVSSFPSPAPTPVADFSSNQFGKITSTTLQQSGSKFIQGQQNSSLFNKPSSSFAQATDSIQPVGNQNANEGQSDFGKQDSTPGSSSQLQQTQQYNGEIYQYNKPPQTPPASQNAALGQSEQQGSSSSQTFGSYKPSSQIGSQFTQQSFGQTQQGSHGNQVFNNIGQFESHSVTSEQFGTPASYGNSGQIQQTESGPSSPLKPTTNFPASQGNQAFSFHAQGQYQSSSRPSSNSQPVQGASKFPPAYNKENVPECCKTTGTGSQSSQVNQENKAPQFGTQTGAISGFGVRDPVSQGTKPVQSVSSFAGAGETFGGPRKPPSFDASGYHY